MFLAPSAVGVLKWAQSMVSSTWISSQQNGTIALRVYWEISENQSVVHWGRPAERGRTTQRCLYGHTHSDTHTCSCCFVLHVCVEGQTDVCFGDVLQKLSPNTAGLARKWLPMKGKRKLHFFFKIEISLSFFFFFVYLKCRQGQAQRKHAGFYEWAARKPNWTMIEKSKGK